MSSFFQYDSREDGQSQASRIFWRDLQPRIFPVSFLRTVERASGLQCRHYWRHLRVTTDSVPDA
jgi:hypothetical protein